MRSSTLLLLPALALAFGPSPARAQDDDAQVQDSDDDDDGGEAIPVRPEVVEWLLDMGKLWKRGHADDRLVVFRKLWVSRDQHDKEIQIACRALGERVEGELAELYQVLGVPSDEEQRDPFVASKDPAQEDLSKLLDRSGRGGLLGRTRTYVRFLRALDAQEPDLPAALDRLAETHRRHPWLQSNGDALRKWDDFVKIQQRLESGGLLPAFPPEPYADAVRVRVALGVFERPQDADPRPVTVDGWLLEDGEEEVEVFTDHLERKRFALGLADVPEDLLPYAGGPLPRLEELDLEAATFARLGAGIRSYAGRQAVLDAGALTYGQESLLQALYLWRVGRRGLAVRLFETAEAVHQRDKDRAARIGLVDGFAAALRVKGLR